MGTEQSSNEWQKFVFTKHREIFSDKEFADLFESIYKDRVINSRRISSGLYPVPFIAAQAIQTHEVKDAVVLKEFELLYTLLNIAMHRILPDETIPFVPSYNAVSKVPLKDILGALEREYQRFGNVSPRDATTQAKALLAYFTQKCEERFKPRENMGLE